MPYGLLASVGRSLGWLRAPVAPTAAPSISAAQEPLDEATRQPPGAFSFHVGPPPLPPASSDMSIDGITKVCALTNGPDGAHCERSITHSSIGNTTDSYEDFYPSAFRLPAKAKGKALASRVRQDRKDLAPAGLDQVQVSTRPKRARKPAPRQDVTVQRAESATSTTPRIPPPSRRAAGPLRNRDCNARQQDGDATVTPKRAAQGADATMMPAPRARVTAAVQAIYSRPKLSPPPALPLADPGNGCSRPSTRAAQQSSRSAALRLPSTSSPNPMAMSSTPVRVASGKKRRISPPRSLPSPSCAGAKAANKVAPLVKASTPPRCQPSHHGRARSPPSTLGLTVSDETTTGSNDDEVSDSTVRSFDAEASADALAGLGLTALPSLALVQKRPVLKAKAGKTTQAKPQPTATPLHTARPPTNTSLTPTANVSRRATPTVAAPSTVASTSCVGPIRPQRTSPRRSPLGPAPSLRASVRPGTSVAARIAAINGLNGVRGITAILAVASAAATSAAPSRASAASSPLATAADTSVTAGVEPAFTQDTSRLMLGKSLVAALNRGRQLAGRGTVRHKKVTPRKLLHAPVGRARITLLSPSPKVGCARITALSPASSASGSSPSWASVSLSPAPLSAANASDISMASSSGASQLASAVRGLSFKAVQRSQTVKEATQCRLAEMTNAIRLRRERHARELADLNALNAQQEREKQAQHQREQQAERERNDPAAIEARIRAQVEAEELARWRRAGKRRPPPEVFEQPGQTKRLRFVHLGPSATAAHDASAGYEPGYCAEGGGDCTFGEPNYCTSMLVYGREHFRWPSPDRPIVRLRASSVPLPTPPRPAAETSQQVSFQASETSNIASSVDDSLSSSHASGSASLLEVNNSTSASPLAVSANNAASSPARTVHITVTSPAAVTQAPSPACANCSALLAAPQHVVSDGPPAQLVEPLEADLTSDSNVVRAIWSPTAGLGPGFQDESLENVFVTRCKVCDPTWFRRDRDGDVIMKDVADCTC